VKGGRLFTLVTMVLLLIVTMPRSVTAVESTIAINEVMFDPQGADTGFEWIELYNPTCESFDLSGYTITASSADYYTFGKVILGSHEFITIHWRAEGIDTDHDVFTGVDIVDSNMGNTSGYVALFEGSVRSFNTIRDYVSYGLTGQAWSLDAIEAGLWVKDETVSIGDAGTSIGLTVDGKRGDSSQDWSVQNIASPGDKNGEEVGSCITVSPTPTLSPIPTIIDPTPVVIISPTPSVTPTPEPIQTATLTIQNDVVVDHKVPYVLEINNAKPNYQYIVKIEAKDNTESWYFSVTLGNDNQYYAWNSPWSNFPVITTDGTGNGVMEGAFKVKGGSPEGTYFVRAKIKESNGLSIFYSSQETVSVIEPTPDVAKPTPSLTPSNEGELVDTTDGKYSAETVSSISDVKNVAFGTLVSFHGVVTASLHSLGKGVFYVSDDTGGIQIVLSKDNEMQIDYGDEITIVGEYGQKYGESVVRVSDKNFVIIISHGVHKDPVVFNGARGISEFEGQLVSMYGVVSETSGDTFYVDVEGQDVRVYVKESTGIDKPSMRVGYYVKVTGIVSLYKDSYRVLPRFADDILVSKEPFEKVLGVMVLPKTGAYSILGTWFMVLALGLVSLEISTILKESS